MERIRRTTNRSPYEAQVTIEVDSEHCLIGDSKDISAGGMFIIHEDHPIIGSKVLLIFDLPNIPQVQIPAFVRWYNDSGFGVQFAPIGARETYEINLICKKK